MSPKGSSDGSCGEVYFARLTSKSPALEESLIGGVQTPPEAGHGTRKRGGIFEVAKRPRI